LRLSTPGFPRAPLVFFPGRIHPSGLSVPWKTAAPHRAQRHSRTYNITPFPPRFFPSSNVPLRFFDYCGFLTCRSLLDFPHPPPPQTPPPPLSHHPPSRSDSSPRIAVGSLERRDDGYFFRWTPLPPHLILPPPPPLYLRPFCRVCFVDIVPFFPPSLFSLVWLFEIGIPRPMLPHSAFFRFFFPSHIGAVSLEDFPPNAAERVTASRSLFLFSLFSPFLRSFPFFRSRD